MSTTKRALLFVVCCLIPAFAYSQDTGRLLGRVLDPNGKPIQGVVVTTTSPDVKGFRDVETTDKKGVFMVDFRTIDVKYHYRFEKPGYQTFEVEQTWHKVGTEQFEWTMKPAEAAAPGAPAAGQPAVTAATTEPAAIAYNAGVVALKAKDYATAEAKFKEAVAADPKLAQGWTSLALVQLQTGHFQESVDAADKAIELSGKTEAVLTARYQALKSLKDDAKTAAAMKDLEAFGRRAEEAKKAHNEGTALAKTGDNAAAYAKFQEALNLDPNLQPSLVGLATAALKLGKNAEAADAAEKILQLDPTNGAAIRLRYNACLALNDPNRLADALVSLAAVDPVVASKGLLKLAFDAYDANDYARAKDRFDKVLRVDANQVQAHYYAALIAVNQGNMADAKTHLEKIVALAPNSQEAAQAREMLKQIK